MEILFVFAVIGVIIYFVKGNNASGSNEARLNYENYLAKPIQLRRSPKKIQTETEDLVLNAEKQKIFDIIENQIKHVFITGKAGTGKSYLLQYLKQNSKKRLVVVAPTGVASLNVGGQTIHSLFRIPPEFISKEKLNELTVHTKTAFILRNIDAVVIDEISMVRADLMDAIENVLKKARKSELPFGGVQIIMFGDLYQLPPVVSDRELHKYFEHNYGGHYFFNAHAWDNISIDIYELNNVFRQKDENFRKILDEIRQGSISETILAELNTRANISIPERGVIILATTNNTVSNINTLHLSQLPGKISEYRAAIAGELKETEFPTDEVLKFKVGSQVMFLKNDREKRWVNGTIGIIKSLSDNEIRVEINGINYPVQKAVWKKIRYYYNQHEGIVEEEVVSEFIQYPLKLAWAITIHKSQGQTYNSVAVDMGGGAFAHGQTYVALSRCTTLDGLYLKRNIFLEDIIVDPKIIKFMSLANIIKIEDIGTTFESEEKNVKIYTIEEKKKEFKNAYEPWTKEDDNKLKQLFFEGKNTKEISEIFKRTKGAVNSRIKKLGLRDSTALVSTFSYNETDTLNKNTVGDVFLRENNDSKIILAIKDKIKAEWKSENSRSTDVWIWMASNGELREALNSIPKEYKEVLIMKYFSNKSCEQIGKIINETTKYTKNLASRAKSILAEAIYLKAEKDQI